jgi:hypothetical protein
MKPMISFPTHRSEQPQKNFHEAESPQPAKPSDSTIGVEPNKPGRSSKAPLPSGSAGSGTFSDKDQSQFAAAPPVTSKGGIGGSVEVIRPKEDEKSATGKAEGPPGLLKEKADFTQKSPMGKPRTEEQEIPRPSDALEKEGRKKSEVAEKGVFERKPLLKSVPAPAAGLSTNKEYPKVMDLNLQVKEMGQAFNRLENLLNKVGAQVIERSAGGERAFIKTEMASSNFSSFLNQLEEIGRVDFKKETLFLPAERVTILIHIAKSP